MRSQRTAIVLSLAAAGAALIGGFEVGATGRPSARQAASVQARYAVAAALARDDKTDYDRGLNRGQIAGDARGRQQGRDTGAARGAAAGKADAGRADSAQTRGRGAATGVARLAGTGGVLVVGDSLEVLSSPYLARHLPSVPLTVNVKGGYSSLQIFELFRQGFRPSQSVIVFDAGTNDNPAYPEILDGRLRAVAKIVGDRCLVVPTIHGLTVDGIDSTGKNRVVRAFARSRPGTQVPDWAGFMAQHPELMQRDDLHPIAAGADARAELVAEGVRACLRGRR
jgi:hypothetical protein